MPICRDHILSQKTDGIDGRVLLLGLDFGSTTSSALVAEANILSNTATGQMEFGQIRIVFRSDVVFTPFLGEKIDILQISKMVDTWLEDAKRKPEDFFSGGVIITGLAARRENSCVLIELIEEKIGEVLIATADDPGLESWLAFMGSCSALSRLYKNMSILNLDVGGGTTNPALGMDGRVRSTGCYFIGARHFQFIPGSYRVTALTEDARTLLALLNIRKDVGDLLQADEIECIVGWQVRALEAIVAGDVSFFETLSSCMQVALRLPPLAESPVVTFSGGVGEFVYRAAQGGSLPSTTYYGDLGIDLARGILASSRLSRDLDVIVPENQGRATVYGLTLHSTEVSGTTIYLPHPQILPLRHLPVIAQINEEAPASEWQEVLTHFTSHSNGAAIQIIPKEKSFGAESIRTLGQKIAHALRFVGPPEELPLVLLFHHNAAKTLGSYATEWGNLPVTLVVIDEVLERNAGFINIGTPYKQIIPVAFYGMH